MEEGDNRVKRAIVFAVLFSACSHAPEARTLHVAVASNLARLFPSLASACKKTTGLTLIPSLGATSQLAQQIENGGPFDLFLAAEIPHITAVPGSVRVYAQGRLVLYAPRRADIQSVSDLKLATVKKIGVAQPDLAPYGKATIQAMTKSGVWPEVEPKVVYGQNISAVLQFVDSSNVDCAFTALALVYDNPGHKIVLDPFLYAPLNQGLAIPASTKHPEEAAKAAMWFVSPEAHAIFSAAGYGIATQEADSTASHAPGTVKP